MAEHNSNTESHPRPPVPTWISPAAFGEYLPRLYDPNPAFAAYPLAMAIEGLHEEIRESPSPICHRVEDLDRWLRESTVHHMPNGLGYADFRGSRIIIVDWSLASVDLTDSRK